MFYCGHCLHTHSIFWRESSDFGLLKSQSKKKMGGSGLPSRRVKIWLLSHEKSFWEVIFKCTLVFLFFTKNARLPRWCYVRQVKSEVHNPLTQRLDTGQIVLQISSCLGDRHIEGRAAVQCSFHILSFKEINEYSMDCSMWYSSISSPKFIYRTRSLCPLGQGCHSDLCCLCWQLRSPRVREVMWSGAYNFFLGSSE